MITRFDIVQGTEQWHQLKWAKIGGSKSKGLFVKSDTLMIEIISQILEPFSFEDDGYINAAMQRGNELEPYAISELAKYANVEFTTCGWLQAEFSEIIGISPDGISSDFRYACEVKCPSAKKHTEYILADEVPNEYIFQCLHYFTVNPKLEKLYFASFRPESMHPLFLKTMAKDSIVNLGTKAKPILKTVAGCVILAKIEVENLEKSIEFALKKINGL